MVVALLLVLLAWVVALLIFRKQYARLLGVDPDRKGWRRVGYLWGYVALPSVILVAVVGMLIAELAS